MKSTRNRIKLSLLVATLIGTAGGMAFAADQPAGSAGKGEVSQQTGQQGLGVEGAGSSNVILRGPDIIIGRIRAIEGDEYAVQGDRGQSVKLRVNKDTNMVCAGSEGTKVSTSREGDKERKEIPISPATESEMKRHDPAKADQQMQALNDPNRQQAEHQMPAPSKDPSTLKDVVGSTDPNANKDVAKGSGFVVGGSGGCQFKAGDQVRIEATDNGTITTIKALGDQAGSTVAGKSEEQQ